MAASQARNVIQQNVRCTGYMICTQLILSLTEIQRSVRCELVMRRLLMDTKVPTAYATDRTATASAQDAVQGSEPRR